MIQYIHTFYHLPLGLEYFASLSSSLDSVSVHDGTRNTNGLYTTKKFDPTTTCVNSNCLLKQYAQNTY